ncbi:polysaccharide deacetylase family protein [uncultured Kriegella sp.]|uniref:polysaccharide deacetylase family protein n=1 Tax=uncultured Kriegella sp. TaxID=1798910 RepID=UPI0030D80AED|tara:strand:- start:20522 stop:21292 length:771 start_codon:yes stop_codon:yes gene_type:complete
MRFFSYLLVFLLIISTGCKPVKKNIKNPKTAILSFIFDDLNTTDAHVKSIFDEFDFKPSFALTTNKLNPKTAPLYKSYSDEGISILSHSYSHIKMQDPVLVNRNTLLYELKESKKIIESYGIPVLGFVTPNSFMHPDFLPLLQSDYNYAFTNNNKDSYDNSVEKLHLSRYGIESNISKSDHNISTIKARIDQAIANKELLVFYGHALPSNYLDDFNAPRVNAHDLRAILAYIKPKVSNHECLVLTSDLAIQKYYED